MLLIDSTEKALWVQGYNPVGLRLFNMDANQFKMQNKSEVLIKETLSVVRRMKMSIKVKVRDGNNPVRFILTDLVPLVAVDECSFYLSKIRELI